MQRPVVKLCRNTDKNKYIEVCAEYHYSPFVSCWHFGMLYLTDNGNNRLTAIVESDLNGATLSSYRSTLKQHFLSSFQIGICILYAFASNIHQRDCSDSLRMLNSLLSKYVLHIGSEPLMLPHVT